MEAIRSSSGPRQVDVLQIAVDQVHVGSAEAVQSGAAKISSKEGAARGRGPVQVRAGQVGSIDVGPIQPGALELGSGQVDLEPVSPGQVGPPQQRPAQVDVLENRLGQIDAAQVHAAQIEAMDRADLCGATRSDQRQELLRIGYGSRLERLRQASFP